MLNTPVPRRKFLKSASVAGAGMLIMPSGSLFGSRAANNRLNIALIGVQGRGKYFYNTLKNENVVALCDVNDECMAKAAKEFPKAKRYRDWRKCLEQKDLDAVIAVSTDHTHAHLGTWALNRDLHVYLEKPMGISVHETRYLRHKYLEKRDKLATQIGTANHARRNYARVKELVRDGAIGELKEIHAWTSRVLPRSGYPAGEGPAPSHIDWDLWVGPSSFHPYSPSYFGTYNGDYGPNCLHWNMYWDFGGGQLADMGSHIMDIAWNVIDGDLPTSISAEGEAYNPEVTPVDLKARFVVPANEWRGELPITWWQGRMKPESPDPSIDLSKFSNGVMFRGTGGYLIADYDSRILIPYGREADLTYYQPRKRKDLIPDIGDFKEQWTNACRGDLKTSCDFEYNGKMLEMLLLALVAYRTGEALAYDGESGKVIGNDEANRLLRRPYREGWPLDA